MKNNLSLLLLASNLLFSVSAVEQVSLSENLQRFEPYLGDWAVCWTDSAGRHLSGKASLQPEGDGSMVKFRVELVRPPGRGSYVRWALFYWDPQANSIAEFDFDSEGAFCSSLGTFCPSGKIMMKGKGRLGSGNESQNLAQFSNINGQIWTAQLTTEALDRPGMRACRRLTMHRSR